jgi:hypothetical protein
VPVGAAHAAIYAMVELEKANAPHKADMVIALRNVRFWG